MGSLHSMKGLHQRSGVLKDLFLAKMRIFPSAQALERSESASEDSHSKNPNQ